MLPVQFITHETSACTYEESARLALRGGCRWIQLRVKHATDEEVRPLAERLLKACGEVGAVFVIDDRVELVRSLGADGVHLGANDMPVEEARKLLGPAFIIGATANTSEQALAGARAGADYLGVGPFRFTRTKDNLAPLLGTEGIGNIVKTLREAGSEIPVCAIGGITPDDVPALQAVGADAVAVSGAILQSSDPVAAMRRFFEED